MKAEQIGALFWLGIALYSLTGSLDLELGNLREPGSGLFSFAVGGFVALMALIVLLQSFLKGGQVHLSALWKGLRWYRPLIIGLIIVAYILVLERAGFVITSFFVLLAMLKGVENLSWRKATLISASVAALSFLLFDVLLKASLPKGYWGF